MQNHIIISGREVEYREHPLVDQVDVDLFFNSASLEEKSAVGELLASLNDATTWEEAFVDHMHKGNSEIFFHSKGNAVLSVAIHNEMIYVLGVAVCADEYEDEKFRHVCRARYLEIDQI